MYMYIAVQGCIYIYIQTPTGRYNMYIHVHVYTCIHKCMVPRRWPCTIICILSGAHIDCCYIGKVSVWTTSFCLAGYIHAYSMYIVHPILLPCVYNVPCLPCAGYVLYQFNLCTIMQVFWEVLVTATCCYWYIVHLCVLYIDVFQEVSTYCVVGSTPQINAC